MLAIEALPLLSQQIFFRLLDMDAKNFFVTKVKIVPVYCKYSQAANCLFYSKYIKQIKVPLRLEKLLLAEGCLLKIFEEFDQHGG